MRLKTLYPDGACGGTTQTGNKCQIRDIFQNGFCQHHGGTGTLLRVIHQREKLLKKTERFKKKLAKERAVQKLIDELKERHPGIQAAIDRIRARNGGKPA